MSLAPGIRLGPYEIVAPLGAGGMGEVYRARDARLDRDVAVKVLPSEFARDPMRLERFTREARAAAALNHPNILAVYDIAADGEVHYLVSELLKGTTLADRVRAGDGAGLSVRKTIDIAHQIAQGLAAAHAKGIVHRDLKPANVFITSEGRAKILDFGLAKQAPLAEVGVTTMGADASPQTDPGQVLGTVGYMAPEQLRGREVDARTDIFAFGAVLYEMLSGRRAFAADTSADTIFAIMGRDVSDLTSTSDRVIPPALQRIVSRCLEKDPAARFHSAADLAFALQALTIESVPIAVGGAEPIRSAATNGTSRWREWTWAAIALMAVGVAAVGWGRSGTAPPTSEVVGQFDVQLPVDVSGLTRLSLSPDGRWLAISGSGRNWLRSMADGTIAPMRQQAAGTRVALCWAPDSSAFAYLIGERLMQHRIDGASGVLAEVGPLAVPTTGAWSSNGDIVLAGNDGRVVAISTTSESRPVRVLRDTGATRRIVDFLPGSGTFISIVQSARAEERGLFRTSADGLFDQRINGDDWDWGSIVDDETILLKRGTAVYEQRLARDAARLEGEPQLLTSDAPANPFLYAASRNGVLVSATPALSRFRWFERNGASRETVGSAANWTAFAMDRSGERVAAVRPAGGGIVQNVWLLETTRAVEERLTFGAMRDSDPTFGADGGSVLYDSGPGVNQAVTAFVIRPGREPEKLFEDSAGVAIDDWSPDGRWVVYHQRTGLPGGQIGTLFARDLKDSGPSTVVARCQGGTADEARVSPDGRWLAFNCSESQRNEVYVVPFPAGGERVRVSVDGGVQPAWRGDSREIFFLALDGTMMSVNLVAGNAIKTYAPRALFKTEIRPSNQTEQYRVTADGQRFLLLLPEAGAEPLRVIVNWRERYRGERGG